MSIEELIQGMASGYGSVKSPEKLGSNIRSNSAVPWWIKPEDSPPPAPTLLSLSIFVVKCMYVNFFINQFMFVTIGIRAS